MQPDKFIKDEVQHLRVAMGHEDESIDGYVEAHETCLNDIMYFPTRDGYGLASVANHAEKLTSLQNEFETVKKKMVDETKKRQRHEQKIKVLTNGYQKRYGDRLTELERVQHLVNAYRLQAEREYVNAVKDRDRAENQSVSQDREAPMDEVTANNKNTDIGRD
ncbi:hypothetical protein OROMI_013617 [Orobanche minor]